MFDCSEAIEGLSFGTILDELRRDLAIRSANLTDRPGLGFHHASAFSQAARGQTGKTPSQYRRVMSSS
jgi:AraC-like DNA-binding protein